MDDIYISSVAVYGIEIGEGINEEAPLLAADPYGQSKIQAEELILDWGKRHGATVGIVRLPLVAGKNPPGNLGRHAKGHLPGVLLGRRSGNRSTKLGVGS